MECRRRVYPTPHADDREPARRLGPRVVLGLLVVGLVAGLAGCANRVTVPDQPPSATRAFLVNHGRHASLVLPAQDEGWLRYSHGEWRWYALNEKGVWRALQAILWPTRAAIGRGRLAGPPQDNRPVPGIPEGYVEATGFAVPASRVAALRRRLDGYFETADTRKFQPLYQLEFVPYPKDYWFMHQSNEVMANWLRALGLEVTGPTLFSEWQFR